MGKPNINVNVGGVQSLVPYTYKTVILKPNVVGNKNILTQDMMSQRDTKYVVKYNYIIDDSPVTNTATVSTSNVSQCVNPAYASALAEYNLAHDAWIDADNAYTNNPNDTTLAAKNAAYADYSAAQTTLNNTPQYYYYATNAIVVKKGQHISIPEGCVLLNASLNGITDFVTASANTTVYIGSLTAGNYDYTVQNAIVMPSGCLIEFDGGSISNGAMIGNNTILIYNQELTDVIKNVLRQGTFVYNTFSADEESLTKQGNLIKIKDAGVQGKHLNSNVVDNEDIHLTSANKLQFKDRGTTDGMGKIILRKGSSFASQLTQENTIYEIRYNFDLNGANVTIPANCVLEFDGGSLSNGTIDLNQCKIADISYFFFKEDLTLEGSTNSECYADWFAGDDATKIEKAIQYFKSVNLNLREYTINRTVNVYNSFMLKGCYVPDFFYNYHTPNNRISTIKTTLTSGSVFNIRGVEVSQVSAYGSYVIKNISFIGDGRICDAITFTSYGGPARPVVINECLFTGWNKAVVFDTSEYDSSTTGTGCGEIHIYDNSMMYNNYAIFAHGRYVIGSCVIQNNIIEQNVECAIKMNSNSSYSDVSFGSISILNNLLEGQSNAIDIKTNNAYVTINDNYFEYINGQTLKLNRCTLEFKRNHISSTGIVSVELTSVLLFASQNRKAATGTRIVLKLKGSCTILENDLDVTEFNGLNFAAYSVGRDALYIQQTVLPKNTVVDGICYSKRDIINLSRPSLPISSLHVILFRVNTNDSKTYYIQVDNDHFSAELRNITNETLFMAFGVFANTKGKNIVFEALGDSPSTLYNSIYYYNTDIKCIPKPPISYAYMQIQSIPSTYKGLSLYNTQFNEFTIWSEGTYGDVLVTDSIATNGAIFIQNVCNTGYKYHFSLTNHQNYYIEFYYSKTNTGEDNLLPITLYQMGNTLDFIATVNKEKYPYIYIKSNENKQISITLRPVVFGWKATDGAVSGIKRVGTFSEKPTAGEIYVGFKYFCTDKQTTEGATDGIEIIHKGSDVWVDALGRVVS